MPKKSEFLAKWDASNLDVDVSSIGTTAMDKKGSVEQEERRNTEEEEEEEEEEESNGDDNNSDDRQWQRCVTDVTWGQPQLIVVYTEEWSLWHSVTKTKYSYRLIYMT